MINAENIFFVNQIWSSIILISYVIACLTYIQSNNIVISFLSFTSWTIATASGIYLYCGISL